MHHTLKCIRYFHVQYAFSSPDDETQGREMRCSSLTSVSDGQGTDGTLKLASKS